MPETIPKSTLLDAIQSEYSKLEALLAPLSEQQMTTPTVNGNWSIKDNIAHLTAWHGYTLSRLRGVIDGKEPPEFLPGLNTEDEENERLYQESKDRPLAEVLETFRVSYRHVLATIQAMSEESLNAPFPWSSKDNFVWPLIAGNTYEHYQEHADIIRRWLARS